MRLEPYRTMTERMTEIEIKRDLSIIELRQSALECSASEGFIEYSLTKIMIEE
jgi:hypothetical protein